MSDNNMPKRTQIEDITADGHIYVLHGWQKIRKIEDVVPGHRLVFLSGSVWPLRVRHEAILWFLPPGSTMTPVEKKSPEEPVVEQKEENA